MKVRLKENNYREKDDRHNQNYWGRLSIQAEAEVGEHELPPADRHTFSKSFYRHTKLRTHAVEVLEERLSDGDIPSTDLDLGKGRDLEVSVEGAANKNRYFDDKDSTVLLIFKYRINAEKPSLTPSMEEAEEMIGVDEIAIDLHNLAEGAFEEGLRRLKEEHAHNQRVQDATLLAKGIAENAIEEGSDRIDYEERLNQLKEEREEAIEETVEEWIEKYSVEEIAEENDMDPRAVEAALDNWKDFASTGFSRSTPSQIDPEKVD